MVRKSTTRELLKRLDNLQVMAKMKSSEPVLICLDEWLKSNEQGTFADYMNNLSTQLASDSSSNQTALKTGTTVLNSIQDSRDSLSGVSLDEEATNMMAYVSAYNAASRLMTALDEVLNTLISNTGA